jgi:hypothetical protein
MVTLADDGLPGYADHGSIGGPSLDAVGSGRRRTAWGNNWVVVGVLVRLPFVAHRMLCLPVLARLWQPRRPGHSKLALACQLVGPICQRHPGRQVHLACDSAYAGKALRACPKSVRELTATEL